MTDSGGPAQSPASRDDASDHVQQGYEEHSRRYRVGGAAGGWLPEGSRAVKARERNSGFGAPSLYWWTFPRGADS